MQEPIDYVYQEPEEPSFGPLPEGEYDFTVIDIPTEPYRSHKGNVVLSVKLAVGNQHIYDNPSAGKYEVKSGPDQGQIKTYDNIAKFLKSVRRNPASGQRPDLTYRNLVGAKGRCKLKVEIAAQGALIGKPVNRVSYYISPSDGGTIVQQPPDNEPSEIPF